MTRFPMIAAAAVFAALSLVHPAGAQETDEAEERGLTSPDVQESLTINPTEQGTLPPDPLNQQDEPALYDLLANVRRAPPTLDATEVMRRPNELASEPAKEMPSEATEEISLFPEGYVE